MKTLVTGADGFIGSHLAEALVRAGHEVVAFVQYNSFGSWGWLDHAPEEVRAALRVVAGDVRDPRSVREALRGQEAVLHLAALIAIPYSYTCPQSYLETNAGGTLHLLEAARDLGTPQVILTSTSEVYGTARQVPILEDHPLQAQSPYAASKIAADQMGLAYFRSFATPVTILRPFNTYGPRQSTRAIIPTIIGQIASGQRVLRLGSLHPTRDFNFVADTVAGFQALLEHGGAPGQVLNLGSGTEVSIGDLVRLIAARMGAEVEVTADAERVRPEASEVERLVASADRLRDLTGWRPRHALAEGLDRTIQWLRDPGNPRDPRPGTYHV